MSLTTPSIIFQLFRRLQRHDIPFNWRVVIRNIDSMITNYFLFFEIQRFGISVCWIFSARLIGQLLTVLFNCYEAIVVDEFQVDQSVRVRPRTDLNSVLILESRTHPDLAQLFVQREPVCLHLAYGMNDWRRVPNYTAIEINCSFCRNCNVVRTFRAKGLVIN